jgi:hypothetical protein
MNIELLKTTITAVITLAVIGVMGFGVLTEHDVGVFEPLGTVVIGYWFGAKAQEAVTKVNGGGPSVL